MNSSIKAIGVDVGGTKIKAALVNESGRVLKKTKLKTPIKEKKILHALIKAIKRVKGKEKIEGIGVGFAGFVDSNKGIVISSPNISSIKNTKVKEFLEKKFECKIVLENDANMFALGEFLCGLKKKYSNIVALTLGTGVGSGIIINGKLLKGKGIASELGHTIIDSNSSEKCNCGNRGCFEAMVCGRALVKRAEEHGLRVKSAKSVAKKAVEGNKAAKKAIKKTAHYLGIGLANAANSFDPEAIVIGGGLSNIDSLLELAEKEMKKHVTVKNRVKVLSENLNDQATVIGAALAVINEFVLMEKKPLLAVDCIIEKNNGIVLIKRRFEPKGWALPGGLVEYNESLEEAVRREMLEETGLKLRGLKQFRAYSDPKRDPRQHSVSVVFTAKGIGRLKSSAEATNIRVFSENEFPRLVFDHKKILKDWAKEFKDRKQK